MKQNRKQRNELLKKMKIRLEEMNKSGSGTTVGLNVPKKTERPRMTRTRTVLEVLKNPRPQKEKKKKMSTVLKGNVKWFNNIKGFGFITGEDGKEYFFHHSELGNDIEARNLTDGYEVEFKPEKSEKGLQAKDIIKQK